jgi:hypothetical protein
LSPDLQAVFPGLKGFSANNLWLMRQFYSEYSTSDVPIASSREAGLLEASGLEQPVQEPSDRDQCRTASHPRVGLY